MAEAAKKQAVYEDLYTIPENMTGEIIDGELIVTPRPARRHAHAASALGADITPSFQFGRGGPGGWIIYYEPELHFGKNVLVPDLAGWRRERLSMLPDEHRFTVRPDWVCEILSPGTARRDRMKKMRIYAQYEVPYAWLIDPMIATLEVFRIESGKWLLLDVFSENEKVKAEPFHEVEIDLANLWLEDP
ncbi:MAG: Uma2 family endonuclease, partial [Deltaproteobacteria bacterium]